MKTLRLKLSLLRHKLLYGLLESPHSPISRLGDPCAWDVCLDAINSSSTIVCAGAGNDISFEIELHARTGANIILLDPSPTGKQTVENTSPQQMEGIQFRPHGLAPKSGRLTFAVPANPSEGSYAFDAGTRETVDFECRSLKDLMAEHGFSRVDFLKMDIEGFEWEVLNVILKENMDVRQICVEFHPMHGPFRSGLQRYLMLFRLRLCGYQLVSHHGTGDHTFIRADCV